MFDICVLNSFKLICVVDVGNINIIVFIGNLYRDSYSWLMID